MKKCNICVRECSLGHSFCGRRDEKGNLKNAIGYSVAEENMLFDKPICFFSHNMEVLSIGSYGCNFKCKGCQNASLSWAKEPNETNYGFTKSNPKTIALYAFNKGCKGICFTYNEPAICIEWVEEIAKEAKKLGLYNFLVTNSTLSTDSVKIISPLIDAVATDIKSMDDNFFFEYCGINIPGISQKILSCIKLFKDNGVHVEVRTNVIPGANDSEENFRRIAIWIRENLGKETPWHISRFFPAHQLSHLQKTPYKTIKEAVLIGNQEGLSHVLFYLAKACDCYKNACCK